jgi:ferric-dicitrate binding protein FerR (iron transport regulator)
MLMEITRDVVNDLWPLVDGGEASADSRALVERYLAQDKEFSETLRRVARVAGALPQLRLSPEAERRLLDDARERTRNRVLLAAAAIGVFGIIFLAVIAGAVFLLVSRP